MIAQETSLLPVTTAVARADDAAARITAHLIGGGDLTDMTIAADRVALAVACWEIAARLVKSMGNTEEQIQCA